MTKQFTGGHGKGHIQNDFFPLKVCLSKKKANPVKA